MIFKIPAGAAFNDTADHRAVCRVGDGSPSRLNNLRITLSLRSSADTFALMHFMPAKAMPEYDGQGTLCAFDMMRRASINIMPSAPIKRRLHGVISSPAGLHRMSFLNSGTFLNPTLSLRIRTAFGLVGGSFWRNIEIGL